MKQVMALLVPLVLPAAGRAADLCGVESTPGNIYYVSPAGNDTSGQGTSSSPWRTLQFGVNRLQAGDTLVALPGTYRERITPPRSGTPDRPIRITGTRGPNGEWLSII